MVCIHNCTVLALHNGVLIARCVIIKGAKTDDGHIAVKTLDEGLVETHEMNLTVAGHRDRLELISRRLILINDIDAYIESVVVMDTFRRSHLQLGCS